MSLTQQQQTNILLEILNKIKNDDFYLATKSKKFEILNSKNHKILENCKAEQIITFLSLEILKSI